MFVPVAFTQVMFEAFSVDPVDRMRLPVTVRFVAVAFVTIKVEPLMLFAKRLVPVAFVKFRVVTVVEAADKAPVRARVVPVAFVNVKFWRVVRPETTRAAMLAVPVTVR